MTIPSPFTTFPSLYHVIFVLGVEAEQPSKAELVSLTVTLVGVWRNLGGAKEKCSNNTRVRICFFKEPVGLKFAS